MPGVAGIVLAAGAATRFGGRKLLAPLDGAPMLQHVVDAAVASALDPVIVVVGHDAETVLWSIWLGRARAVMNADWATGQASSIKAGLNAVRDADAVAILLGDQPRITPALIGALVDAQRASGAAAVVSTWRGHRSPPALVARSLFPALEALEGDSGARAILASRDDVVELAVSGGLGSLDDVDRPEDLAALDDG